MPTIREIKEFQEYSAQLPQVQYPVYHHHSTGVYVREFHMPAGYFVIGKEHKTRHLNIVVKGHCFVWTAQGKHDLCADSGPVTFESMGGVKKVVYAKTDIVWMTIHATSETDQEALEGEIIQAAEQESLFPELDDLPLIKAPSLALEF